MEIKMIMKYIKKIFLLAVIFTSNTIFAQTRNIGEDEKIIYAMLMNQIQYSLQVIEHYQSRLILDQEYENIICKIDKTKLKDKEQESITAYSNMLTTLTNLKLQDNEKTFIRQQAEKEKTNNIYKSLFNNNTGFGLTATSLSLDPIKIVSGLVYTGVSAIFNYKDAISSAENIKIKDLFRLEQQTLKTVEMQKNALWTTYSKFITIYDIPKKYEIKQDQMLWLVETLDNNDTKAKINLLEQKRSIFYFFSPYWFELGRAYQTDGNNIKAEECYNIFEQQKARYSIIDNDTYYTELAKNMILIAKTRNDIPSIKKYLNIISKDKTANNESENRFYMAGVYFTLGENEEALRLLKLVIDDNRQYVMQARTLYEYIVAASTKDFNYKKVILLGELKIATEEELKSAILAKKGKLNIIKKTLNFFTENEKTVNSNNLTLFLPINYGQQYSLSILINDKYYDSIIIDNDDRRYFFVNYDFKSFIKKNGNFTIILNGQDGDEITLEYNAEYFDSSDIKSLYQAYSIMHDFNQNKNLKEDLTNTEYFNVSNFLTDFKQFTKNKELKKIDKEEQLKLIIDKYNSAYKNNLSSPFFYKKNILSNNDDYLYIYGLISFSDKTKKFTFSKYGDLSNPNIIKDTFSETLEEKYKNALIGNSESQYSLGMAYLNGEGIEINYFETLKWFKLSALKGNMNAYYQLGICFENGYGTYKDKNRANYYYLQASNLGHKKAKEKIK